MQIQTLSQHGDIDMDVISRRVCMYIYIHICMYTYTYIDTHQYSDIELDVDIDRI